MLTISFYVLTVLISITHGFFIYEEQKRHDSMEEKIEQQCKSEFDGDNEA